MRGLRATRLPTMVTSHSANSQPAPSSSTGFASRRTLSLTALLVVGALGLSACGPGYDEPTDAAEQMANHLESDQLESFEETTSAQDSTEPSVIAEATEQLADYPRTVNLESVTVDEEEQSSDEEPITATAQYRVTWDLSGSGSQAETDDEDANKETAEDTWSYTTEATLIWNEETEAWEPQLAADTLVPGLAEGGRVDVTLDPAQRGDILDTHGEALATERPVQRIGIDKTHVLDGLTAEGSEPSDDELEELFTTSATDLAEALDLDPEPLVERVPPGSGPGSRFIVLRDGRSRYSHRNK